MNSQLAKKLLNFGKFIASKDNLADAVEIFCGNVVDFGRIYVALKDLYLCDKDIENIEECDHIIIDNGFITTFTMNGKEILKSTWINDEIVSEVFTPENGKILMSFIRCDEEVYKLTFYDFIELCKIKIRKASEILGC